RYRMQAARGLALAAAERLVDGIHRHAANVRALALPAAAASLADRHVFVVDVADLADGGEAFHADLADFARRHLDRGVVAFFRHELDGRTGAPRNLTAASRLQLHVVQLRAERNVLQRETVARQDVDALAGDDRIADFEADAVQDVALLPVRVGEQRNAR